MSDDVTKPRKYPFLPASHEDGWLPYMWLVYVGQFVVQTAVSRPTALVWALDLGAVAAFLTLYFRIYWESGWRRLALVAGEWALGVGFAHWNPMSSVFVVFAAAALAHSDNARLAWKRVSILLAATGLASWVFRFSTWFWLSAVLASIFIATIIIHQEQRRKLNRRLGLAQDEIDRLARIAERERIARDLHDLLGHTLSLIVLKSELASKLADKDPQRAAGEIREVERISRETLSQVRAAVRGYHSAGLDAEIDHAREALQSAGVAFEAKVEPVTISASQESVLTIAIREAITNVVRHAGAKSCQLWLRCRYFGCELEIADDGRGAATPEGFGLSGMRERVESMGGTLERDGSQGMRLILRLPMPGASRVT